MKAEETVEWAAILAENTDLDLRNLNLAVEKYSSFRPSEEPLFLGRALRDTESSIVHHFAKPGALDYPDTESGFFLSRKLVLDLEADLEKVEEGGDKSLKGLFPSDFNIDPAYEFAKFVLNEVLYSAVLYCTLLYYILQLGEGRDSGKYCSDLHQEGLRLRHLLQE